MPECGATPARRRRRRGRSRKLRLPRPRAGEKRRKVTVDDKPPAGDTTYDCLFDDVRTKKSSLQLMNLGPKKLAHTRVALLHSGAKDTFEGAEATGSCPYLAGLDETWWKVLTLTSRERLSGGRNFARCQRAQHA